MVDQTKRTTLKKAAGIAVGGIALASSASSLAKLPSSGELPERSVGVSGDLADIQIRSRVSAQTNDLEVIITNVGSETANITDMTPAEINTARGRFDFDALLKDGPIKLDVGQSVSVPMQHHTVVLDGNTINKRSAILSAALKQNVSIVTDGDSLAAIRIVDQFTAA